MKNPHLEREGASKKSKTAANDILADQHCPNMPICQRWSADDDGLYCCRCWRDFTDPKPLQVAEGRA